MGIVARGQATIVDLNDAPSISMYLSTNQPLTQIFNKENSSYVPNWAASPFNVITPELSVSGTETNQIARLKSAPTYTINGGPITAFGGTVATTAPYALTIKNNMTSVSSIKIECTGIYVDPKTGVETPVKAVIPFSKTENAGQLICAIGTAPKGKIFRNGEQASLPAHCDLWRGSSIDTTNVSYTWYRLKEDGTWETLGVSNTYGITGTTTNEITIPNSAVLNFQVFKCDIKDTDPSSGSYNTIVSSTFEYTDLSDPYYVDVATTTGDKFINGKGTTTLMAIVWQNGNAFTDAQADAKFIFTWKKHLQDGTQDTAWGTSGVKTGRTLTVTAAEVDQKATFVVYLSTK